MQVSFFFTCDQKTHPTKVHSTDKLRDAFRKIVSDVPEYYQKLRIKEMSLHGLTLDPDCTFLEMSISENDIITVECEFKESIGIKFNRQESSNVNASNTNMNAVSQSSLSNNCGPPPLAVKNIAMEYRHFPYENQANSVSYARDSTDFLGRKRQNETHSNDWSVEKGKIGEVKSKDNHSHENGLILYYITNTNYEEVKLISSEFLKQYNSQLVIHSCAGGEKITTYKVKFRSKGLHKIRMIVPKGILDFSSMFFDCANLVKVDGKLDTSQCMNFSTMFYGCSSLKNIDGLKRWNVSNAQIFFRMFYKCSSLKDLSALRTWKTRSLTNVYRMFFGCCSLEDIAGLLNWDVSNVSDFNGTFYGCSLIQNFNALKKWDVSSGQDFGYMFYDCSSIRNINGLCDWDVSKGKNFECMFKGCCSLKNVDKIEEWKMRKSANFSAMFSGCVSREELPKKIRKKIYE